MIGNSKTNKAVLNEQQRKAIEHIYGPLLIVAGAGTGKTRVIVERVGYLLKHVSDLQPENILALTFSRKAAAEMRERARKQFGERAWGCRFSTFHAFCYELLEKHSSQRALDTIDQWIFLRRHMEELELDYYLHVAEPGRFLNDLVEFCSRCHDNLVSPEDYSAYVEQLVADCQDPSRLKPLPKECAEEELAKQREVARVYARSEVLQEQEGLLNFGAMISRAVTLLDSSPDLLRQLQQQYQVILVDEFQDTNPAQFELLVRLAGERKNLAVVGDDDQAIYRFRGASYGSFKQFEKQFPQHRRIVLDENYRSTQKILAVAGAAIAFNLQDRYQPDKRLLTSHPPGGNKVEVREFADAVQQAEFTAAEIAHRVRSGEAKAYSDFAVLYRAHRYRDSLVVALRRQGIPFAIRKLAVDRLPPVRDLLAYLRAIGHPADNISLARVIADPRWGLEANLFSQYCRRASDQKKTLYEVVQEDSVAEERADAVNLLTFLSRFSKIAEQQRMSAWFDLLREELGFSGDPGEKPALQALSEFINQWDQKKSATGLLGEFLEYFGYFEEAGGAITLPEDDEKQSWMEAGPLDGAGETIPDPRQGVLWEETADGSLGKVQLMTVHGAKGLEFEHVIVFHLLRGAFPTRRRTPLIVLPTPLWKGPLPQGDFHVEEERRLFYVALTRARSTLTLCTVSSDRQRPSAFLEELRGCQCPDLEWKKSPVSTPEMAASPLRQNASQPRRRGSRIAEWAAAPQALLAGEPTLSASGLETYLECPLKYQYSHVWRIPLPPSPSMLFGSILHGAVKELVYELTHCPEDISRESIQALLDRHWNSSGFSDSLQERKYREKGVRQLEGVWRVWSGRRLELLHQEKSFLFDWAGTRLAGRVDQIHRGEGQRVELIEYKTGRPQTQKEADNSLQLTIYAKACRDVLGLEPAGLILFNLATQECLQTTRSPQDFQKVQQKIQQTAAHMRAGEFPAQAGYHCRYCDFQPICPAHEDFGLSTASPEG